MYTNGTHLVVEGLWSGKSRHIYFTIEGDNLTLHLVPYPVNSSTPHVVATYVFMNKTYVKAVFSVDEILKALSGTGSHSCIWIEVSVPSTLTIYYS